MATESKTLPIVEEVRGYQFPGETFLRRRVTAAEAEQYDNVREAFYGKGSFGRFVPIGAKPKKPST